MLENCLNATRRASELTGQLIICRPFCDHARFLGTCRIPQLAVFTIAW
ncbi:hypothetical protein APA_4305 [Pseudanabaena sp. lw0831]|nr:hypothetical protein APA_4305 [Pseudanabaena sp. lw0831]